MRMKRGHGPQQLGVLRALSDSRPRTAREIAKIVGRTTGSVAQTVFALENTSRLQVALIGRVDRVRSGRTWAHRWTLTNAGWAVLEEAGHV